MRILHFADLHLGVESYGRPDPVTGLSSRLVDFLRVFDELVEYALGNGVDLVVFAGDAYKSREPTPTQQREFAKRINRLASNGVVVFILVGNHDLPNAIGKATATEIFDTLAVKNVYVSGRPDVYRIETKSGPVQIASLPWARRRLLSREETRELNFEQVNRKLEEALTRIIGDHASRLDPRIPSILLAHVWVHGARTGSEKTISIGHDPELLIGNVADPAFDYVALGHIHRHQVLCSNPPVVYSGSLERLDFGDEDDSKGFYVIDFEPGGEPATRRVSFAFRPVSARRFLTIEVSIGSEDGDVMAVILDAIHRQNDKVRDAIVQLQVNVPAGVQGLINEGELRNALKSAYHSTVSVRVQGEVRTRLVGSTAEGLTPLGALKAWLETRKVAPERARVLLEYGERLIGEG